MGRREDLDEGHFRLAVFAPITRKSSIDLYLDDKNLQCLKKKRKKHFQET